jgi:hypothetical protein
MHAWSKCFTAALVTVLVLQFSGCGTLMYPERRGTKSGHLDTGVVILDAIGLLFFLIPGIIAFAVDFSSGCIYLPATGPVAQPRLIKFDPKHTTVAEIEKIIEKETGKSVRLTQPNMTVTRLQSTDELKARLAQATSDMQNNTVALAK